MIFDYSSQLTHHEIGQDDSLAVDAKSLENENDDSGRSLLAKPRWTIDSEINGSPDPWVELIWRKYVRSTEYTHGFHLPPSPDKHPLPNRISGLGTFVIPELGLSFPVRRRFALLYTS